MTIEELDAKVEQLTGIVEKLATEVKRCGDMIQELSESHDQNRRELQFATKTATDLHNQFSNGVENIKAMRDELRGQR